MPLVRHNGKTYMLRWKPEWDLKILIVALIFRKDGFTDWITADAKGYLRGLPKYLSRRDLSHRLTYLLCIKYNPEGFIKKRQYNKLHYKKFKSHTFDNKVKIFKEDVPDNSKKQFGYKPKGKWNKSQIDLLIFLTKRYPKGSMSIDWEALMKDDSVRAFPPGYSLNNLRHYYWTHIKNTTDPKAVKKRRKAAIKYKYRNYKKYRASLTRRNKIIKNSVNSFLFSKLEPR